MIGLLIVMAISHDWINLAASAGVGGVSVELVRSGFQRKQMDANVAQSITSAATSLLDPLTHANATLLKERDTARRERDEALRQLEKCRSHLARDR